MTPVEPLHNMLAIPPIKYTITKYRAAFSNHLSKLPPTALLRTLPHHDPSAIFTPFTPIPTSLTSLLPSMFPTFCIPTGLTWTHAHVHNTLTLPATPTRSASIVDLANRPLPNHNSIHVYPIPHPDHYVTAFLTFHDGICLARCYVLGHLAYIFLFFLAQYVLIRSHDPNSHDRLPVQQSHLVGNSIVPSFCMFPIVLFLW